MELFEPYRRMLRTVQPVRLTGQVSGVRGLTVSVADFPAAMGSACRILRQDGEVGAEVVGFADQQTLVMPLGAMAGIARGDRVTSAASRQHLRVGEDMLGRVLDPFGRAIDGGGEVRGARDVPLWPEPIPPMDRRPIREPLGTGVRAVDAMLTVGRGQRMGIFSGSGVGKSVLLGMIARYTSADVTVIALVGERGREVRDFVEKDLSAEGLRRSIVFASTSDSPPLVRLQAVAAATAAAEHFRDEGRDVLLLVDSLTRLAWAQRQVGLAAGEPVATKGYPPSVFSLLPQLLERSGRTERGSITAFYTVLVEGDDPSEPISDAVRAVTDGHILLSRELAHRGQYPAVDVLGSVSRLMVDVADAEHRAAAREIHRLVSLYEEVEDLVRIGACREGANAEVDQAVRAMPLIRRFLSQEVLEPSEFARTSAGLKDLAAKVRRFVRPAVKPATAPRVEPREEGVWMPR